VQFTDLNEKASLEWLDTEDLAFRFEYSNRFYGSCTLVAKLARCRTHLTLDDKSLLIESHQVKRGDQSALSNLATTFLRLLLLRSQSLEDLGYRPEPAIATDFRSAVGDSPV
jgi:hypothetical protein